ncbi:hypothetical protein GCM10010517_44070 [Streptosporangium fragile]|uniref:Uncharacterized protein n=1 Tax=Streptosporangium fragile TaxID=46186 RepID=A0ABN3W359_9ACTN
MRPRSILPFAALTAGLVLFCQPVHATLPEAGQGATVVTGIVEYRCVATGVDETQDIKVEVALTMPDDATTGKQMTIGWRGAYVDDTALRVPSTGLAGGTKLYAYASISGLAKLTSATGVGELGTLGAGQAIPLPTAVIPLRTTSSNAGTATVRPGDINFGTRPNEPSIRCEARNATALTTYPLTVASADGRPDEDDQPTEDDRPGEDDQPTEDDRLTTSPQPAHTVTATVTRTSTDGNGGVNRTPAGGAATGGGGESGPDGRTFVLIGFLLILAAATGLLLRRRSLPRG